MSHIGIGGNLIQPNKQCLSCKYWEPAHKSYFGFSIGGGCKAGYCKKRRKEMIKLEVEEYCDDCPEFDAHVEKEVLFAGYSKKYCNTNITCEHKDKCKRLKDMIEKEAKKRND